MVEEMILKNTAFLREVSKAVNALMKDASESWKEETGLEAKDIKLVKVSFIKDRNLILYLFKIDSYEGEIDISKDPDKEFSDVSFKNPMDIIEELKVPLKDDIALQYYINN